MKHAIKVRWVVVAVCIMACPVAFAQEISPEVYQAALDLIAALEEYDEKKQEIYILDSYVSSLSTFLYKVKKALNEGKELPDPDSLFDKIPLDNEYIDLEGIHVAFQQYIAAEFRSSKLRDRWEEIRPTDEHR